MTERINELAIQAGGIWHGGFVDRGDGSSVYVHKKFVDGGDMDVEQFAKLIVQETLRVAGATPSMSKAANTYFGVKE